MKTITKDDCIRVLETMGFGPSNEFGGNVYKEYGGFHCMIWIDDNSIKMTLYGKYSAFSEDNYIGPPLPDEARLKEFIRANT